jgi:hypothetical protein
MLRRTITAAIADLTLCSDGKQIPNRLATQIAVRKQGQVGYRRMIAHTYILPTSFTSIRPSACEQRKKFEYRTCICLTIDYNTAQ